jgi:hypothetical protein
MQANHGLGNGRQRGAFLVGKVRVANETSRMEDRMFGGEAFDSCSCRLVQRLLGGAQVREFRIAARRRHLAGRQQRDLARHAFKRAIGVPELVRQHHHARTIA